MCDIQDAATLAVFQAIDFGQQDEAEAAHQILMDCNPTSRPKLQNAFLSGICESADVGLALDHLQRYSQPSDQHAHLYHTVLTRLACTEGTTFHLFLYGCAFFAWKSRGNADTCVDNVPNAKGGGSFVLWLQNHNHSCAWDAKKTFHLWHACHADVAAVLNEAISASTNSEKLVSALMGALPEGESVGAPKVTATIWALFQQACKHGHALSATAQHMLWLSQAGDYAC